MLNGIAIVLAAALALKIFTDLVFFRGEVRAAMERDPAASHPLVVIFTYPGLQAIINHRIAHFLHRLGIPFLPRLVSQWSRFFTGIEIHPGATLGRGLFIDHGMGVVIGETAVVGDNVTIYQGVTLGGTGKERGKRHPTIGRDTVIGAGAKVLGNIRVGDKVFIGANAVVVRDVPSASTVVGVPGRVTSREGQRLPALQLDQTHLPDPLQKALGKLQHEIDRIERELRQQHPKETKE
jgi:serine O-acetyltransferase